MQKTIVSFSQDAEDHWVANLSCGHCQHVRHRPPLVERPWVLTSGGRNAHLGSSLNCLHCEPAEEQAANPI